MSKFHQYSVNNCILIAMQRPDATCVAGYNAWKSLGRFVKKGERGIRILAPCPIKKAKAGTESKTTHTTGDPEEEKEVITTLFRAVTVFDYAQTEGKPLPSIGPDELTGNCDRYDEIMQAITRVCSVPIRFDDIPGGAKGYFSRSNQEIVIQNSMGSAQTIKTALHELSHSILHSKKEMTKDRCHAETEAESVAFVVSTHFGLDTSEYSFPYLAGWSSSSEEKEVLESLDTIRKTAGSIIEDLETELQKNAVMDVKERSVS